jgi:protein-L-isoaspartate O-methyltransferase
MGGRLIMPVGGTSQELIVMDKTPKGLIKHSLGGVLFVPLIEQDSE